MKRQVRTGCFETNSSSQHSIVVRKLNEYYTQEEIEECVMLHSDKFGNKYLFKPRKDDLSFGRYPLKIIADFESKWCYAMASLVREYMDDVYKELIRLAIKYIPNCEEVELPITYDSFPIKNVKYKNNEYHQKYGKTEKEMEDFLEQKEKDWELDKRDKKLSFWENDGCWKYNLPYTGSIDEDILSYFLDEEGITLEEFLTNKKYIVIQDGDEYDYWGIMKNVGLINISSINYEYKC